MHPVILPEHREFFFRNNYIEFEGLITNEQSELLAEDVSAVLSKRMNVPQKYLNEYSAENAFRSGRDVWRDSAAIKKIVCRHQLAEIAAIITRNKSVRLAYDQVVFGGVPAYEEEPSLLDVSCFTGMVCGLLLCISKGSDAEVSEYLPKQPGNGIYITTEFPMKIEGNGIYLLIVYTKPLSNYIKKDGDLNTHTLKSLGYVFGDNLRKEFHPMVYR